MSQYFGSKDSDKRARKFFFSPSLLRTVFNYVAERHRFPLSNRAVINDVAADSRRCVTESGPGNLILSRQEIKTVCNVDKLPYNFMSKRNLKISKIR